MSAAIEQARASAESSRTVLRMRFSPAVGAVDPEFASGSTPFIGVPGDRLEPAIRESGRCAVWCNLAGRLVFECRRHIAEGSLDSVRAAERPLRLMGIMAHPDDESLGLGGTFARYAAEGVETSLITA